MADEPIVSYPISYRGLTLNEHRSTAGAIIQANILDTIVVEQFDFSRLQFRDQRDGLHLLIGGDLGPVSSEFRFVSIAGRISGSTVAAVEDRAAKMLSAFHPENAYAASPLTQGAHAIDFYAPTGEAGYSSPVREVFYGRPTGLPAIFERRGSGLVLPFVCELICPQPRRYLYTAESRVANAGNSWSVSVPNWTASQGASTTGIITLAMTGAGSVDCTLRYVDTLTGATTNLVLDLTGIGSGAHAVTIDVSNGLIKVDVTKRASARTSSVITAVWTVSAGGGTFSVPTGRTNLTSATFAYRQARG